MVLKLNDKGCYYPFCFIIFFQDYCLSNGSWYIIYLYIIGEEETANVIKGFYYRALIKLQFKKNILQLE